jgi:hypothetical protein
MIDDDTLARALADLAASVPDNRERLAQVHSRVRRMHRRRRAAGGAILSVAAVSAAAAGVVRTSSNNASPPMTTEAPAPELPDCATVPVRTKSLPDKAANEETTTVVPSADTTSVSAIKGEGTITAVQDDHTFIVDVDGEYAARPATDAKGQPPPSPLTLIVDDHTAYAPRAGELVVGAHIGIYAVLVEGTTYHAETLFFESSDTSASKTDVATGEKADAVRAEKEALANANAEDADKPNGLLKGKGTVTGTPSGTTLTVAIADDVNGGTRTITLLLDAETSYFIGATACRGPQLADGQVIGFAATPVDGGAYRANEIVLG